MNKQHIDALAAAITSAIIAFVTTFPTGAAEEVAEEVETPNATDVTGQVDSAGFPWDERIHSGSKSKKDDGTWTYKKGAKNLIAAVEAELRGKGAAVPTAPVVAAPATPALAVPSLVVTPPPAVEAPKSEYTKLCDLIAANGTVLNAAWVEKLFADNNVPGGLPSLANDEARSKAFYDSILSILPKA